MTPAARVAIAIGSNLGDREANLDFAVDRLPPFISDLIVSTYVETAPMGVADQPMFLNAALVGTTLLPPAGLLNAMLTIEAACGRTRPHRGAARTLDLDLILYGDQVLNEPRLIVPHPRFRERQFVLAPLAAIAPDAVDPVTGSTVVELLQQLRLASR